MYIYLFNDDERQAGAWMYSSLRHVERTITAAFPYACTATAAFCLSKSRLCVIYIFR